jgi:hypothetical protein
MTERIFLWAILVAALGLSAAGCAAEKGPAGKNGGSVPFGGVYHAASDGWDIQVTSVETAGATLSGVFSMPVMAKGTFLQVGVALTNTGKSEHALGKDRFFINDAAGRKWAATAFGGAMNPLEDLGFGTDVPPGVTLAGVLSFDVPKDLQTPLLGVIGGGRMDLGGDLVAGEFARSGVARAVSRPTAQGQPQSASVKEAPTATRAVGSATKAATPGANVTSATTGGPGATVPKTATRPSGTTEAATTSPPSPTIWTTGQAPATATATRVPATPTMAVPTRTPTPTPTPTKSDWSPLVLMPVAIVTSADGRTATVTIRNFSSQTGFRGWLDICVGVSDCWPSGAQVESLPPGGTAIVVLAGLGFPSATTDLLGVTIDPGHKIAGAYAGLHRQRIWLNGSRSGPEIASAVVRRADAATAFGNVKVVVRNPGPDFNALSVGLCAISGPRDGQPALRSNLVQVSIGAGRTETLTLNSAIWAERAVVWLCDDFGNMLGPATFVALDQPW